jgi:aldose 1-epimerase
MENLIPTGGAQPVDGTKLDLREPKCLADIDIDDVFIDRIGDQPACVEYRDLGKRVTLRADKVFSHQICYAPPGKPFVCVENLTCAPNAVNLQQAPPAATGFRVVKPGQSLAGKTRFIVEDL